MDGYRAMIISMANTLVRSVLRIAWVVCGLIVAASLDRVPDPPAIQQRIVQLQFSSHALECTVDPGNAQVSRLSVQQPPAPWPAIQALLAVCSTVEPPLLRLAADSSPPVPFFNG